MTWAMNGFGWAGVFIACLMEIEFSSADLERFANDFVLSCQKLGRTRAEWYLKRLHGLRAARDIADLAPLVEPVSASRLHREGRPMSCLLDSPCRLIFRPLESGPRSDAGGGAGVEVLAITGYHG